MTPPANETLRALTEWLHANRNDANAAGMARFAIGGDTVLGIPVPRLRQRAKGVAKDTALARLLWDTGLHEARIMASMIADPATFTQEDMECWCAGFDSWDVCDQCCLNLFWRLPFAAQKIELCTADEREFVRRCAFALMAVMAVHAPAHSDADFDRWLELIVQHASDSRNFVKKAVNWALRQIGKRNLALNAKAAEVARHLSGSANPCERWVGRNALAELSDRRTIEFVKSHRESRFGVQNQ